MIGKKIHSFWKVEEEATGKSIASGWGSEGSPDRFDGFDG